MPLTDAMCLAPCQKRERRHDGGGLYLLASPGGRSQWRLFFRVGGKQRDIGLGDYPAVSIKGARLLAATARAALDRGDDPAAAIGKPDRSRSFEMVAREWFKRTIEPNRETKYAARVWSRIEGDLLPALGTMDVATIEPHDVLRALQAVETRLPRTSSGKAKKAPGRSPVYSARVIGRYASAIFRYARLAHGLKSNPAEGLGDALMPVPAKGHQPALEPVCVWRFYAALDRPHQDEEVTRIALELVMHTVLRSGELRGGRWSEIRGEDWSVPAERMKAKRSHLVPLSRQAVVLTARLRELTGDGPLMFPGRRSGHVLTDNGLLYAIYGLGFKGKASVHGWRSTFSTWAHESGRWPSEYIETCLAHQDSNAIRRAYHRERSWLPQRREIHQAWSDWLDAQREVASLL